MQFRIRRNDVLLFLFCRAKFPRSVSYCVDNMAYYLSNPPNSEACLKHIETLNKTLEGSTKQTKDNVSLHEYIDKLQIQLASLHNDITRTYFPVL